MAILTRTQVLAAVDRALQFDPLRDLDIACATAAASLCIPIDLVYEAIQPESQSTADA